METLTSVLALLFGVLVRLAVPVAVTCVLVLLLRRLDARWQMESTRSQLVEKGECWKVKNCTPELRETCPAFHSSIPCWQVYRLPNGHLNEKCLSCKVFLDAPIPALHIHPRRM